LYLLYATYNAHCEVTAVTSNHQQTQPTHHQQPTAMATLKQQPPVSPFCQVICKSTGKQCPNLHKCCHNGQHVCKLHLNQLKLNEDPCSVCMDEMTRQTTLKLGCGHMFHTNCMIQWGKQGKDTCPLCRAPMDPDSLLTINREVVDYIGKVIFSLPTQRERAQMVDAISNAITNTYTAIQQEQQPAAPPQQQEPQFYVHYSPTSPNYSPTSPGYEPTDERMWLVQQAGAPQQVAPPNYVSPLVPRDPRIPPMVQRVA
jgi:hypothetical protein